MKITHHLLTSLLAINLIPCALHGELPTVITAPSGSDILIRTDEAINSRRADEEKIYAGTVEQVILDSAGNVAVPKGAAAELLVRQVEPKKEIVLDLQSLIVNGRRHFVNAGNYEALQKQKGIGKSWHTARMVGDGSIYGSILGALAGEGGGAATAALNGAPTGKVRQLLTRGKAIQLPAGAVLTFRLAKPLHLYPVN